MHFLKKCEAIVTLAFKYPVHNITSHTIAWPGFSSSNSGSCLG